MFQKNAKKILCRATLIWSLLISAADCFASNALMQQLAADQRYSDLVQLSLMKANECKDARCRSFWLQNSVRASIKHGDTEGASYYLGLFDASANSQLSNLKLAAYTAALSADISLLSALQKKIELISLEEATKMKILEKIAGKLRNEREAISFVAKKLTTKNPTLAQEYQMVEKRSPSIAAILSAVVPGAGHAYLGMWQSSFTSFFLVAICAASAAEQFRGGQRATGFAVSLVGSVFYFGGILSAAKSAHDINDRRYQSVRRKVRRWALPELQFRWDLN
jgi:hypothetical protein